MWGGGGGGGLYSVYMCTEQLQVLLLNLAMYFT